MSDLPDASLHAKCVEGGSPLVVAQRVKPRANLAAPGLEIGEAPLTGGPAFDDVAFLGEYRGLGAVFGQLGVNHTVVGRAGTRDVVIMYVAVNRGR